jgi:hypothetical protein
MSRGKETAEDSEAYQNTPVSLLCPRGPCIRSFGSLHITPYEGPSRPLINSSFIIAHCPLIPFDFPPSRSSNYYSIYLTHLSSLENQLWGRDLDYPGALEHNSGQLWPGWHPFIARQAAGQGSGSGSTSKVTAWAQERSKPGCEVGHKDGGEWMLAMGLG